MPFGGSLWQLLIYNESLVIVFSDSNYPQIFISNRQYISIESLIRILYLYIKTIIKH